MRYNIEDDCSVSDNLLLHHQLAEQSKNAVLKKIIIPLKISSSYFKNLPPKNFFLFFTLRDEFVSCNFLVQRKLQRKDPIRKI